MVRGGEPVHSNKKLLSGALREKWSISLVKSGSLPDLLLCVANSADTLMTYYRQLAVPAFYINILNKFQGKGNWSCCLFLGISCKASQSLCVPLNSTYYWIFPEWRIFWTIFKICLSGEFIIKERVYMHCSSDK